MNTTPNWDAIERGYKAAFQIMNRQKDRPASPRIKTKQWRFSLWHIALDDVIIKTHKTMVDAVEDMKYAVDDRLRLVAPNGIRLDRAAALLL